MNIESLAKRAYAAYEVSRGNVNRGNMPLVGWDAVTHKTREVWREVVTQVLFNAAECVYRNEMRNGHGEESPEET